MNADYDVADKSIPEMALVCLETRSDILFDELSSSACEDLQKLLLDDGRAMAPYRPFDSTEADLTKKYFGELGHATQFNLR